MYNDLQQQHCCGMEVVKLCSLVLAIPIVALVHQPNQPQQSPSSSRVHVFAVHTFGLSDVTTPLDDVLCMVLANNHYQVRDLIEHVVPYLSVQSTSYKCTYTCACHDYYGLH